MIGKLKFITIRTEPKIIEKAATWFSSKWNVPKEAYLECMNNYLNNKTEHADCISDLGVCLNCGEFVGH